MPSFWTRNAAFKGACRVADRRSQSADSRAAKRHSRLAHDQDSSLTELSAEQTRNDMHYTDNIDITSAADEAPDFQSLDEIIDGANTEMACPDMKIMQYKVENERLKELLRSRTHDLRQKCSALSICQTELAESLISQTTDDNCVKGRQIHKMARDLKSRLCHSEMETRSLREERDQAALDLTALSGKMATCTAIAEEQAKLLKGQLDTIRKFEKKIQILEKTMKEMRAGHRQTVHGFERGMQDLQRKHEEKLLDYENGIQDLQVKHKEEVQLLEKSIHDIRAGYKQEQAAIEEQLSLHQQRAALQDKKIKRYRQDIDVAKSELLKGRTREAEMEDHLNDQANICQNTTKELSAATKEIEQLKNVSLELHEQEERMEQLWVDNARLVQLLAESDEYQNLFQDMQGGNGLVYCPSNLKTSRLQMLSERYGTQSSYGPINPKAERNQWIPAELFDIVMAFRKQHCFSLDIEIIQELLRLVGAFWRGRHRKILHEVKLKWDKQMADLKRQLSQRLPYEQVVQSSVPRSNNKTPQAKILKNTSPATRRGLYSHPDQSGPPRDMEYFVSPLTRKGIAREHSGGAHYNAREDTRADTQNSREVQTKHLEASPRRRGSRAAWSRPVAFIDAQRSALVAEETPADDEDDDFYPQREISRKKHDSEGKISGLAADCLGSFTLHKDGGSRQRGHGLRKPSPRDDLCQPQKPQKGCFRGLVGGLFPGENEGRVKLKQADRIAPGENKSYDRWRTVPSSPESSVGGDRPKPRRRMSAGRDDPDGFRSFSGSSSV